jgi:NAD(P)-dependent dehydrogenase (short-subunit alcohol dehydrogenase family)
MDTSMFSFRLDGQLAVVTGGGMGIGAAISAALASAGARVVIVDRDKGAAARTVETLRDSGYAAEAVIADISEEPSVVVEVERLVARVGSPGILVNNAGLQHRKLLLETNAQDWDRMHAVNTRGAFLMLRECSKAMIAAGIRGRIINICSLGIVHPMIWGLAAYASSKGGLMALTRNAAFELAAHGITVNAVLPGGIATPGAAAATGPAPAGPALRPSPLGRCEPVDIAAAVLFLASPAARLITAQSLSVDAGFLLS